MSPQSIHRRIGQLAFVGFDGCTIPAETRALAREFDLGGVVLFARNVEAPAQVAELAYESRRLGTAFPAWVAVDQEGGRVARLRRPFTEWPPMVTLGRSGDQALAAQYAAAVAAELRAVGISMNLAPVLDVHSNPENRVIGDRALGDRAEQVERLAPVLIGAFQQAGVAACGKHFPGHGDTSADSHDELPVVQHPLDRLREVEFRPFRAAIQAGVAAIMTAHVVVPAVDEDRPATFSPAIVQGLLQGELGFGGLVLTDDLCMKAVGRHSALERAAVLALLAGCHGLLLCAPEPDRQAAVLEAIVRAVEMDALPAGVVEDALARHRQTKERHLDQVERPPSEGVIRATIGSDRHQAIAAQMARYL